MSNTERLHEQYDAMFDRRDVGEAMRPYAEGATITDHARGQTISGEEQLREYFQQQLRFSSDSQRVDFNVVEAGDWTIAYGTTRGTHDGSFGPIEATNKSIDIEYCNITRWEDGRIVEDHLYYDLYSILVQMGKAEPLTES